MKSDCARSSRCFGVTPLAAILTIGLPFALAHAQVTSPEQPPEAAPAVSDQRPANAAKPHDAKPKPQKQAASAKPVAAKAAPQTARAGEASTAGSPTATLNPATAAITEKLRAAQVKTCMPQFEALGGAVVAQTKEVNALSVWHQGKPDAHPAALLIGAQAADGSGTSATLSGVMASPQAKACDAMAFHVVPVSKPCSEIERSLSNDEGHAAGDLAGIRVWSNRAGDQVSLLPTAANGCVIVRLQTAYAGAAVRP